MFARFLVLFFSISFSAFSSAKNTEVNLSQLDATPQGCTLQNLVLDCGSQDIVLSATSRLAKLNIKAARIEVQGTIEADQLQLETSGDIVVSQGANLFLKETSSFKARSEFHVHGGLFGSDLSIVSPSVRFNESSDVQIRKLTLTSANFRSKNRIYAHTFRITLTNKDAKSIAHPYAELGGYLEARVLTVGGPLEGSHFVIGKEGILNVEHIFVTTKNYLNRGRVRFGFLKINGEDHASYGKISGDKYEAGATKIDSDAGASYELNDAQIWGADCKDQGKWDSKNRLGIYCQTMTAGENSVWRADNIHLEGGSFFLANSILTNDLSAQVKALYTSLASTQKATRANVLAKYLLLDGSWTGKDAKFSGDVVFFGPNSNTKIQNLEVLIRDGKSDLVRELIGRKNKSQFDQVEKIFTQLIAQEERFGEALSASLSNGNFDLERRWSLHQFRSKIYDSFTEPNATWAAYKLAHLTNEMDQSGVTSVDKENFSSLRQFAFSNDKEPAAMPLIVLGAINSHNLKLRSDGIIFLDESSTLNVSNILQAKSGRFAVSGKIRAKLIDLFAQSFALSESGSLNSDQLHIKARQRLLVKGLLRSSSASLSVENGEIYFGKTADIKSAQCTSINASRFYHEAKIEAGCLHLRVNDAVFGSASQLSTEELRIKTDKLQTSATSIIASSHVDISALEMDLYGLINSGNIFIDSKKRLSIHDTAKLKIKGTASLKTEGLAEISGDMRARIIDFFAEEFRLAKSGTLNAKELVAIRSRIKSKIEGLLKSEGSIVVASDGLVEFVQDAEVHAKDHLSIKARQFLQHGNLSAEHIGIDVEELRTFASSRLDARNINISALKGQLAGYFRSDRFAANIEGNLRVDAEVKSKVIEIFARDIELLEKSKLTAEEHLLLKADLQLKVNGLLSSNGTLQLAGDNIVLSNTSLVQAATVAHIKAKHFETNGALEVKDIHVVADTFRSSSSSLLKGEQIQIDLLEAEIYGVINSKNLFINAEKRLVLRDSAQITAENVASINSKGQIELSGEIRAKAISLFANDLLLLKSGKLSADEEIGIKADLKTKLDGLVESGGNLVVIGGDVQVAKTGKIEGKNVHVKSDNFFSAGTVQGNEVLILDIDKSFSNAGMLKGEKVSVGTKDKYENSGTIDAVQDIYIKVSEAITAKELGKTCSGTWTTLDGEFKSDDVLNLLEGNSGNLKTSKLRVVTTQPVVINRHVSSSFSNEIYAQSFVLEEDKTYKADGDVSIKAGLVHAKPGSKLHSGGNLDIESLGDVFQQSERNPDSGHIKTSEFVSGGSATITSKGKYLNQGSKLLAKETLVIKADGEVHIVPISWVETREEEDGGWFIKETTVIQEEKEQRAKLGGKTIDIQTTTESTESVIENTDFEGTTKISGKVEAKYRQLRIEEDSYKSFTGVGQLIMLAGRVAVTAAAANTEIPGAEIAAGFGWSYLESQMLNREFDPEAALKQAVIGYVAGFVGGQVGSYVGATLGKTAGAAMIEGASRTVTAYVAQACLHDGCKKFDMNHLGEAALTGALHGAVSGAGAPGGILEETGKEAIAGTAADLSLQGMRGENLNWEKAAEQGLHAATAYASGRATNKWIKSNPQEKPIEIEEDEKKSPEFSEAKKEELKKPSPEEKTNPTNSKKEAKKEPKVEDKPTPPKTEKQEIKIEEQPAPGSTKFDEFCFPAGTIVKTTNGEAKIEDLVEGDIVVADDSLNQMCALAKVDRLYEREVSELVEITVNGVPLLSSTNHPFFVVEDDAYRRADELTAGLHLLSLSGESIEIEDVHILDLGAPTKVYNIEVEGFHNYYVGDEQILVHNCDAARKQTIESLEETLSEFLKTAKQIKEDPVKQSVDALKALGDLIEHREELSLILIKKVTEVVTEFPEYSAYQKGVLAGKLFAELTTFAASAGVLKVGSILARIAANTKIASKAAQAVKQVTREAKIAHEGVKDAGRSRFGSTKPASSSLQGNQLKTHLENYSKYGKEGFKELENGRMRYYGKLDPAKTPGEMAGRRLVREWDVKTNQMRTWHETIDHTGKVRQVRPEAGSQKVHFTFDKDGNYNGHW